MMTREQLDEIRARHLDLKARYEGDQCTKDREALLAEVDRLRDLLSSTRHAEDYYRTGGAL